MLLLRKNRKHIFIWSYIQYYSTVTNFSLSFPSVHVFLNDGNWKREKEPGDWRRMQRGRTRKSQEVEKEGRGRKGGTNRIKTTQRRKPLLPGNAGILWPRTQPSVLKLPPHLFSLAFLLLSRFLVSAVFCYRE